MGNQRGIALIITLLVVTLLTISVVEFTYSVTIDHQMTNNALTAMQAQLLARAGINYGEALLARDPDQPPNKAVDWYFEDWAHPDVASVIALDPGDRLEVRVLDESGKININRTRPPRGVAQPAPGQPNLSPDAFLRDALRRLFEANEVDVQIPDRLLQYWGQSLPPLPGQQQAQLPGQQQPQLPGQQQLQLVDDFRSVEDFGAMFGIPASKLTKLRRFLTALPVTLQVPGQPVLRAERINVNTAPAEVLAAVINDQGKVQDILEHQGGEQPINQAVFNQIMQGIQNQAQIVPLFGYGSSYFRVCASAQVAGDPTGERPGGVGQTVVALVSRQPIVFPPVPPNAPLGVPRWTLTPLDWQKRGGAALLIRQDPQTGDPSGAGRDPNGLNGLNGLNEQSTASIDACS